MPNIYPRARLLMVGTLPPSLVELRRTSRFAHPTAGSQILICLNGQINFACNGRDKLARRANQSKPVQPFAQKYSAFVLTQITRITPLVSRQMRGVGHRHERAVRCGGRRWRARRTRRKRTAKSCGSGAAVLALSWRDVSRRRRRQKSRSPGRARSKP